MENEEKTVMEEATETEETTETAETAEKPASAEETPASRRVDKKGNRRGKFRYAVPVGIVVTILALVGVVSLVIFGIGAIARLNDTTQLKKDIYYFLEPVLYYNPTPFENINETEQDAFLNAAAYRVSLAEQIRMLVDKDENCAYPVDDQGRIVVPALEIENAYHTLFGSNAPLTHRTVEEGGLTYSEGDNSYYVPFETLTSGYKVVIADVDRQAGAYVVKVGFVANADIPYDEHGNLMEPTAAMATYFQTYTLTLNGPTYYISACADN